MMILTENAQLYCKHGPGHVTNQPSQSFVTVEGARILVESDPVGRTISGCPSVVPFKPCLVTLVVQKGYSDFIRIGERRSTLLPVLPMARRQESPCTWFATLAKSSSRSNDEHDEI
jgi:hypothetical protein